MKPITKTNTLKSLFSLIILALVFSLSNSAIAAKSKLVGHWIGNGINIKIKADHSYKYKMLKIINVGGKWSATSNSLTLNYSSFGKKKKKVATYHFKGKNLVLRMKGKKAVTLKKQ